VSSSTVSHKKTPEHPELSCSCCHQNAKIFTPVLKSLHWLKINELIKYKLLSLTHKVLTTNLPQYLHNLISVQPCHNTRSSSMVTLARPPTRSSLKITNCSLRFAAPCLCEPHQMQPPALSPITHGSSSSSSLFSLSPLASSLTRSVFHSELKIWLFGKSFLFYRTDSIRTLGPFNIFILLNGWICLHGVLD